MTEQETAAVAEGSAEEKQENNLSEDEKDFRDFIGVEYNTESDPKWDNKRFRTVYRKSKDLERANEQLTSDFKVAGDHIRKLTEASERIAKSTESVVKKDADTKLESAQQEIETLGQSLTDLKNERKLARIEQDWDKVDTLEDQIESIKDKINRKTSAFDKVKKEIEKKPPEPEKKPDEKLSIDVKAIKDFVQETPWFNMEKDEFDPVMASAAKEYDTALMMKDEFKDKPEKTKKRLEKVKEYIEKRFKWEPPKKETRSPGVEGVGNEFGDGEKKGKITLSSDEKRVAHMMLDHIVGPTKAETEYIRQKSML